MQNLQRAHQDKIYRTSTTSIGQMMEAENGDAYYPMDKNVVSYTNLKKPKNTIDM